MKREEVKKQLRDLSKEGESGSVLPAALLDIMEAGEKNAEIVKQISTLESVLKEILRNAQSQATDDTKKLIGQLSTLEFALKEILSNAQSQATGDTKKLIGQLSTLESALKEILSNAQLQATDDTKKLIEQLSALELAITEQNAQKFTELRTILEKMLDDARSKSAEESAKNMSMISGLNESIENARLEHATTGKKLSWSIGLSAVAAVTILALLVMELLANNV